MQLTSTTTDAINGYDVVAISSLPPELMCAVCGYPAFGGVSTHCEHIFHKKCLLTRLANQKECPTCKERVVGFSPFAGMLSKTLDTCFVRCPQKCESKVAWGQLSLHVERDCPNTQFTCPHDGCKMSDMSRSAFEKHLEECDHAIVICSCSQQVKRKDLKGHKTMTCLKELVKCGYCNDGKIERGAIAAHLSTECNTAAAISLMEPMHDLIMQLTDDIQKLKQQVRVLSKRKYEFRLNFPTPIDELPVDSGGKYTKPFGQSFQLELHPRGSPEAPEGYASVHVSSSTFYDASLTVRIGNKEKSANVKLGPEHLGGTGQCKTEESEIKCCGWHDFALQSEIRGEAMMRITVNVKTGGEIVVNL